LVAALELSGKLSEIKLPVQAQKSFYAWLTSYLGCAGDLALATVT
jgi:hypothetical protein